MNAFRREQGLTLLELIIVLGLIAVLSSVALQSVAGLFEERRYDANLDQLEEIDKAVLGENRFEPSGFVADIGRLPVVSGTDPAAALAELWDQGALPAYAIGNPPGDGEVLFGAGWRGPYLNLGITRSTLYDGFGFPFLFLKADSTPATDGETIGIVESSGSDNAVGGDDFATDQRLIFEEGTTNRWQTPLSVEVTRESGDIASADGTLYLRVYGAENGQHGTVEQLEFPVTSDIPSHTFSVPALPLGPKVFRVYQATSAPADDETPITSTRTSAPLTTVVSLASGPLSLTLD